MIKFAVKEVGSMFFDASMICLAAGIPFLGVMYVYYWLASFFFTPVGKVIFLASSWDTPLFRLDYPPIQEFSPVRFCREYCRGYSLERVCRQILACAQLFCFLRQSRSKREIPPFFGASFLLRAYGMKVGDIHDCNRKLRMALRIAYRDCLWELFLEEKVDIHERNQIFPYRLLSNTSKWAHKYESIFCTNRIGALKVVVA